MPIMVRSRPVTTNPSPWNMFLILYTHGVPAGFCNDEMRQFRLKPVFRLQIIQQTYLQSLQTQANGVFVGGVVFGKFGRRVVVRYLIIKFFEPL